LLPIGVFAVFRSLQQVSSKNVKILRVGRCLQCFAFVRSASKIKLQTVHFVAQVAGRKMTVDLGCELRVAVHDDALSGRRVHV
jgi:hypothetical protein